MNGELEGVWKNAIEDSEYDPGIYLGGPLGIGMSVALLSGSAQYEFRHILPQL